MVDYNPKEDYCTASPDVILGCTINYGCYLHDRHYRNERKNRFTRLDTDILLRNIIYNTLKSSNVPFELRLKIKKLKINILFFRSKRKCFIKLRKLLAYPFSRIYYYAVRLFARKAYL